jgi:hypothetical protein
LFDFPRIEPIILKSSPSEENLMATIDEKVKANLEFALAKREQTRMIVKAYMKQPTVPHLARVVSNIARLSMELELIVEEEAEFLEGISGLNSDQHLMNLFQGLLGYFQQTADHYDEFMVLAKRLLRS